MFNRLKTTIGTKIRNFVRKHDRQFLLGQSAEGYYVVRLKYTKEIAFLDPTTFEMVDV